MGVIPEIPGFGFWKCRREMGLKGKLNKAFLHFLPNVWTYLTNSQNGSCSKKLWKIIKVPKIWQKNRKSLVQLALNPFFGLFWVPDPSQDGLYKFWSLLLLLILLTFILHIVGILEESDLMRFDDFPSSPGKSCDYILTFM